MFRCKECQAEYETKPDYCDCGNDTFEEIVETPKVEPVKEVKKEIQKTVEVKDISLNKSEHLEAFVEKQQTKVQQVKKEPTISIQAWIVFGIFLLISLIIILLPVKTSDSTGTSLNEETQTSTEIPSIEKLWNNTPAKVENNVEVKEEQQVEVPQQEEKITKVELKKIPQTAPTKQITEKKTPITKSSSQKTTQKTVTTTQKTVATTPKQDTPAVDGQEIARYNIRLRNYIASKIDFAGIVGDGSCTFTFKVDANGNIISKKAGNLSDNDSMNEKVYNALRQTNTFNAPPTGYNTNKTLTLHVKMQRGAFEVSLY